MQHTLEKHPTLYAALASTVALSLLSVLYFTAEPSISIAQVETRDFTISQTITGETAFEVDPGDVTMSGSISGLTGGVANGTTTFVVRSNNSTGYRVDISFNDDDADGTAMLGSSTLSDAIRDYNEDQSVDYNYSAPTTGSNAVFAFTVDSDDGANTTDDAFLSSGSICGSGTDEPGQCWTGPSTTAPTTIVNRNSATAAATSSVIFRVEVPNNASPVVPADVFIATATLSLFENP